MPIIQNQDAHGNIIPSNPLQDKINKIEQRTESKKARIQGYKDADTPVLEDIGSLRTTPTTGNYYDSAETQHGNMPFALGKSGPSMDAQRLQAASAFNLPADQITDQHIASLGDQQMVQQFFEDSRTADEPDWKAPLITPIEGETNQTDLSAETYAPLGGLADTNVLLDGSTGNRALGSTINPNTGVNTVDEAALDPERNASLFRSSTPAHQANQAQGVKSFQDTYAEIADKDGFFGELADQVQSQGLKLYADTSNMLRKASRAIAETAGVSSENVDKYLPINADLIGTDEPVQEIRENQQLRDEIAGLKVSSRKEWQEAQKEVHDNAEKGEYGKMAWNIVTHLPQYLADSAPEMAAMMIPVTGLPTVVGTRLSNQMEDFKKNNKRDMTLGEAVETGLAITATLYAEKVLVKTGVAGAVEGSAGSAGKIALATGGEAVQEVGEKVQEDIYTGDVARRRNLDAIAESATDTDAIVSAATGAGMGGSLSATGQGLAKGYEKLKEKGLKAKQEAQTKKQDVTTENASRAQKEVETAEAEINEMDSEQASERYETTKEAALQTGAAQPEIDPQDPESLKAVIDMVNANNTALKTGDKSGAFDSDKTSQARYQQYKNSGLSRIADYIGSMQKQVKDSGQPADRVAAIPGLIVDSLMTTGGLSEDTRAELLERILTPATFSQEARLYSASQDQGDTPPDLNEPADDFVYGIDDMTETLSDSVPGLDNTPADQSTEAPTTKPAGKKPVTGTGKVKVEEEASQYTKETIEDIATGTEEGKTTGITARTINRLAKQFKIPNTKVRTMLEAATGPQFAIKQMGHVSPTAKSIQYDAYYGENGVVPMYTAMRKALAEGNQKEAVKAANSLISRTENANLRKARYEYKYNQIKGIIEDAITNGRVETTVEALSANTEFLKPEEANHKVDPAAILAELQGGPKSPTTEIVESMQEIDSNLRNILTTHYGFKPAEAKVGKIINRGKEVSKLNKEMEAANAEITDLVNQENAIKEEAAITDDTAELIKLSNKLSVVSGKRISKENSIKSKQAEADKIIAKMGVGGLVEQTFELGKRQHLKEDTIISRRLGLQPGETTKSDATRIKREGKEVVEEVNEEFTKTKTTEEAGTVLEELEKAKVELKDAQAKKGQDKAEHEASIKAISTRIDEALKTIKDLRFIGVDLINIQKSIQSMQEQKDIAEKELTHLRKAESVIVNQNKDLDPLMRELADNVDNETVFNKVKKQLKAWLKGVPGVLNQVKLLMAGKRAEAVQKQVDDLDVRIRVATENLNKTIKDLASKESTTGVGRANVGPFIAKSISNDVGKVVKLQRAANKLDEASAEKIKSVKTRVKELRAKLFNGSQTNKLFDETAEFGKEGGTRKVTVNEDGSSLGKSAAQPTTITDKLAVRNTITNSLTKDEMLALIEDPKVAEQLNKILTEAPSILNDVLRVKMNGDSVDVFQLLQNPAASLMYNKDGGINEYVAQMIAMASTEFIGTNGTSLLFNNDDQIARMDGKQYIWQVNKKMQKLLKTGRFKPNMAAQIGGAIAANLGISAGTLGEEHYDKVIQDLGQTGLLYLEGKGLIKPIRGNSQHISAQEWAEAKGDESSTNAQASMPMVRADKSKKSEYIKLSELMKEVDTALDIEPMKRNYKLQAPKKPRTHSIRGSYFAIPKTAIGILDKLEQLKYSVDMKPTENLMKIYKTEEGKTQVLKSMGWKDTDSMQKEMDAAVKDTTGKLFTIHTQDSIDAQAGVNLEAERDLDELEQMYDSVVNKEISNEVFFEWVFTKNGRYMPDSIGINPQTSSKLHRWLVTTTDHMNQNWDLNDKEDADVFYERIGQAFGFSTDKERRADSVAFGKAVADMKDKGNLLERLLSGEEIAVEVNGKQVHLEAEHVGHTAQATHVLELLDQSKDGKVVATLAGEYDSTTSGFNFKTGQIPLKNAEGEYDEALHHQWAAKAGTYMGEYIPEDGVAPADIIASNENPDAYKTLGSDSSDAVGKDIEDVQAKDNEDAVDDIADRGDTYGVFEAITAIDSAKKADDKTRVIQPIKVGDLVTKYGRDLFKAPFMTFNYAASIKSIKRYLGMNIGGDIQNGIQMAEYSDKSFDKLRETFKLVEHGKTLEWSALTWKKLQDSIRVNGMVGTTVKPTKKRTKATESKPAVWTEKTANTDLEQLIGKGIEATYGSAVEDVMNNTFGSLVEVNDSMNDSFTLMFRIFQAGYKQAVDKKNADLLKSDGRVMTSAEKAEIIYSMADRFPMIRAIYSEGREDSVAVFDSKRETPENTQLDAAQTWVTPREGESTKSTKVQTMVKELDKAIAAGAVLPIHWLDGATIGKIMADYGVQGVHDALVVTNKGQKSEEIVKAMNEGTYNAGKDYNMLQEVLISLRESLEAMPKEDAAEVSRLIAVAEDDIDSPMEVYEQLEKLVNQNNKARDILYSTETVVGNVASGPTSMYKPVITKGTKSEDGILPNKEHEKAHLGRVQDMVADVLKGCI